MIKLEYRVFHRMLRFTSKDKHRDSLQSVRVIPLNTPLRTEKGAMLVATDGHILVVQYDPMAEVSMSDASINVRSTIGWPAPSKYSHITLRTKEDVIEGEANSMASLHSERRGKDDLQFIGITSESSFPDWRYLLDRLVPNDAGYYWPLLPEDGKVDTKFAFDPKLWGHFSDLTDKVAMFPTTNSRPVFIRGWFRNPQREFTGVIMPMLEVMNEAAPEWFTKDFWRDIQP